MLKLKEGGFHDMIFYNFVSKEHGVVITMNFDIDDNTKKIEFPTHFSSYKVEKHHE